MSIETFGVAATARELGVTTKYIYDLIWSGKIAGATRVDGTWAIPRPSVRALQKRRTARKASSAPENRRVSA
jgi:hypothetical protein